MEVNSDTGILIGTIAAIGVFVGALTNVLGSLLLEWHRGKESKKSDKLRQKILKKMLEDPRFEWRKLSTLAAVVGCTEEQAKDHLVAISARGSETNEGQWGLISRNPLSSTEG